MFGIHRHFRVPGVGLEKLQIETGKYGGYGHVQLCVCQTIFGGFWISLGVVGAEEEEEESIVKESGIKGSQLTSGQNIDGSLSSRVLDNARAFDVPSR